MPRHPDRQLERLSQPVAAQLLAASGTAVVAAGSVEQHGGHLPLGTDAFAARPSPNGSRSGWTRWSRPSARWAWLPTICRGPGRCPCPRAR